VVTLIQLVPQTSTGTRPTRSISTAQQQHHVGTVLELLTLKVVVTLIQLVPRTTTGTKRTYRPIWSVSIAKQHHLGWYSIGTAKNQKLTVDKGASCARKFQGPPGRSTPGASKFKKQDFVPTHCKGCWLQACNRAAQLMKPPNHTGITPHSTLESSRKSQAGYPSHLLEHDTMTMNHILIDHCD
jgi:hypothetical protein